MSFCVAAKLEPMFDSVMVEGGARIISSLLELNTGASQSVADQLIVTIAPVLVRIIASVLCLRFQMLTLSSLGRGLAEPAWSNS